MFTRDHITYEPLDLPDRMEMSDNQMLTEAETFHDRMKRRHSVRDFSDRPVPRAVIEACVRAAGTAPSGANHQPWHFVAISDPDFKHRIRLAAEEEERKFYVPESTGIATGMLLTALHHAGLVALTHTPNPMKFLNEMLGRPDHEKPTMIIAVGHPAEDAKVPAVAKIKKSLDEILTVAE